MAEIARLALEEQMTIDRQRLDAIVAELGNVAAMQIISAALEQLALAMTRTVEAVDKGDLASVTRDADRLARLAWQLGLVTMAGVAVDVGRCAEGRDQAALLATAARLRRIGGLSLTRIWDPPG
ncbi:hypothetical protein [Paracoccus ravus]|uniref:hypothetical protein n=1 Tax=Paracoccus ravus TaxID=2447760 RepID=UPI00106EB3AA|nr:hypothetical protein [Paracoccus ravus]